MDERTGSPPDVEHHGITDIAALFAVERDGMVRLATLLVGSAAEAEEVVQDAFVALDDRWEQVDRPGAYLRTTVTNGCRAVLRRRAVEDRHRDRSGPPPPVELPTNLVELHEALATLNERRRTVVVLRYFVDLPDSDIAEILGCRPATVRSLARRALAALRKELT